MTPTKGLKRTDSELAMLAEKATLLGRDTEDLDEPMSPEREVTVRPLEADIPEPVALTSPTAEGDMEFQPIPMSEKARGKMRATDSTNSLTSTSANEEMPDDELERVAAAGVGPNGYVPTQEWVASWQKG
jgi:hypothetical protein